eukprot:g4.t1
MSSASRPSGAAARAVRDTWARDCGSIIFFAPSAALAAAAASQGLRPVVAVPSGAVGRPPGAPDAGGAAGPWRAWPMVGAIREVAKEGRAAAADGTPFDWVLVARDDTYVVVPNLLELLRTASEDADTSVAEGEGGAGVGGGAEGGAGGGPRAVALGQRVHVASDDPFAGRLRLHGGAGVVLNRVALAAAARCGEWPEVAQAPDSEEALAECMAIAGVVLAETRDGEGRERFHFDDPARAYAGGDTGEQQDAAFDELAPKTGEGCCSHSSVYDLATCIALEWGDPENRMSRAGERFAVRNSVITMDRPAYATI